MTDSLKLSDNFHVNEVESDTLVENTEVENTENDSTDEQTSVQTPVAKLNKDGTERKKKSHSETRTLCGADALNNKCEIVTKDIASVQVYNERVALMVEHKLARNETEARAMLKNTSGLADTLQLRKMIRLSVMRSDVCTDAIKLVRIAQYIATQIGAGNEITTRDRLKNQAMAESTEA